MHKVPITLGALVTVYGSVQVSWQNSYYSVSCFNIYEKMLHAACPIYYLNTKFYINYLHVLITQTPYNDCLFNDVFEKNAQHPLIVRVPFIVIFIYQCMNQMHRRFCHNVCCIKNLKVRNDQSTITLIYFLMVWYYNF